MVVLAFLIPDREANDGVLFANSGGEGPGAYLVINKEGEASLQARQEARIRQQMGRVAGVVKFPSSKLAKQFWISLLDYWPPDLGQLHIVQAEIASHEPEWLRFQKCMGETAWPPVFSTWNMTDFYMPKSTTRIHWKNNWKFFLDGVPGDADILAIIDDDSCLIDSFVPDDILTPDGKIIVHGFKDWTHNPQWEHWITDQVGLPYSGHYMSDFPMFVWRDMLPDLRAWMVQQAFGHPMDTANASHALDQFWHAYAKLFKRRDGTSEYNLIFNFARFSPKWKSRYDWRLAPRRLSLGLTLHQHIKGCPRKWELDQIETEFGTPLRDLYLFFPYNLLGRYHPHNVKGRAGLFAHSSWFGRRELARAEYEKFLSLAPEPDPKYIRSPMMRIGRQRNLTEWNALLEAHKANIRAWGGEKYENGTWKRPLSVSQAHPGIYYEWDECFH